MKKSNLFCLALLLGMIAEGDAVSSAGTTVSFPAVLTAQPAERSSARIAAFSLLRICFPGLRFILSPLQAQSYAHCLSEQDREAHTECDSLPALSALPEGQYLL